MLKFDDERRILRLGVHDLIEAGPASGHLRMQVAWSAATRMRLGQEVHVAYQAERAAEDTTFRQEVRVKYQAVVRGWEVRISGRIDGLSQPPDPSGAPRLLIEEVKSTTLPTPRLQGALPDDFPAYARQVQLYLHFLAAQGVAADGELVMVSLADGGRHRLPVPADLALDDYIRGQLDWIILQRELRLAWLGRRRAAVELGLPFPHPQWRPGQKELADEIVESLSQGKTMLLAAPTGYGKTAAALHAALTVAYRTDRRVFFATARTTQQRMAEQVLSDMARLGLPVQAVSIRAREKMCLNEVVACRPDACPYAVDYHDKVREGDLLQRAWRDPPDAVPGVPRPDSVVRIAQESTACPFALTLDLGGQADVVIGDFNYAFDPGNRLSVLGDKLDEWLIIVDEAHNLPDRAMGYGSPELPLVMVQQAAALLASDPRFAGPAAVVAAVEAGLIAALAEIPREANGEMALPVAEGLDKEWLGEITANIESLALEYALQKLERPVAPPGQPDPWMEVAGALGRLRGALERAGEETLVLWRKGWRDRQPRYRRGGRSSQTSLVPDDSFYAQDPETGLKLLCRDPSPLLGPVFAAAAGAVCMSATLSPPDFYQSLLGLDPEKTQISEFPSPFPPENRQVLIAPQVSTEYKHRDRDRAATAALISQALAAIPGNAAVFFPSFAFRDAVLPLLDLGDRPALVQERGMTERERDALLATLRRAEGHALLGVLGGIFSEGVDLPGASLTAAVIVGPALPQAGLERNLMQQWYQERYQQGFRYAWLVPGMARVIQAAGRVIRTPEDRGSIVLICRRFLQRDYQAFFPLDWTPERANDLAGALASFWRSG